MSAEMSLLLLGSSALQWGLLVRTKHHYLGGANFLKNLPEILPATPETVTPALSLKSVQASPVSLLWVCIEPLVRKSQEPSTNWLMPKN